MTRLVRRAPASLIPILAALFLAGALAVFSANPAHAQEDPVRPLITLQAELLPGEVSIPQGASAVFYSLALPKHLRRVDCPLSDV